jgi:hypothetical protein
VTIQVTYTVTAAQLTVSPTSLAWSITPTTQAADLTQTVSVGDTGAALTFSVTSSVPWVSVSPTTGTSGTTVSATVDLNAFELWPNGSYAATLTFTYSGTSVSGATRTLGVTLALALPLVQHVGPYVSYVGSPQEVVLRGHGLAAFASPTVRFGATSGTGATVVNDTELRVTPPSGLTAGRYQIEIANDNALGLHRSTAELVVVAPRTHTATRIPSSGPRSRLAYDPERGCFYGAHTASNSIERFCDSGSAWTTSSVAVTGVLDVALSVDGKELLATSSDTLYRIDPATLTVTSTVTSAALGAYLLDSIAVTNDGSVILAAGNQWLKLYRYDLAGGSAAVDLGALEYAPSMASIMSASLDGDSVITGDSGITWPFLRRYDAADGTFTAAQLPDYAGSNYVTVDRAGHRIGAGGKVYNGSLALLGTPANWRLTVSANGARAYAYVPGTPSMLRTYDITGSTIAEVGTGTAFTSVNDPGSTNNASNLLMTSHDSRTLFIDGTTGILVVAAP